MVLLQDGSVWAVGSNTYGQLGDGTTASRSTWAKVPGVSGATAIAVGAGISFALLSDGRIASWGLNNYGQAGQGTTANVLSPTVIPGLTGVKQIRSGSGGTYALLSDGTVRTWGRGANGRLGLGDANDRLSPTTVPGVSNVVQIEAGYRTGYALRSDGTVLSWGGSEIGQLGTGGTSDSLSPVQVQGLSGVNVTAIASGMAVAFALANDGTVYGWGRAASSGNNKWTNQLTPALIAGLSDVTAITGQYCAGAALISDGTVRVWGQAWKGAFGTGSDTHMTPIAAPGLSGHTISKLPQSSILGQRFLYVAGIPALVGLSASGGQIPAAGAATLSAVVRNAQGQPAAGEVVSFSGPSGATFRPMSTVTNSSGIGATQVDLGAPWTVPGKKETFTAVCNGTSASNSLTVLGSNVVAVGKTFNAQTQAYQTQLQFPSPVKQIVGGNPDFFLALLEDGSVWGMGGNDRGQLGDGTTTSRSSWAPVLNLTNVQQIALGYRASFALMSDGTVMAWGWGQAGLMGTTSKSDRSVPTPVDSSVMTNVAQIMANGYSAFAVTAEGSLYSWGQGPLGDGSAPGSVSRSTPGKVAALGTSVATATIQNQAAVALLKDGSVWAWGGNSDGQVGDGTTVNRGEPVQVVGMTSGVTSIVSGTVMAYALRSDGTVWAWGRGDQGSLGNGTTTDSSTPVQVQNLTGVQTLGASGGAGYAVLLDGSLRTWGHNAYAQLGDGSTVNRTTPVAFALPAGRRVVRFGNSSNASSDMLVVTAAV
jgi:alpha-tubulin suppressor-like RCC1 family protein